MSNRTPTWHDIYSAIEDETNCDTILDMSLRYLDSSTQSNQPNTVNRALTECANSAPDKAIEVLEKLIEQRRQRQGIERGLEAVGNTLISQVNDLIIDFLDNGHRPPATFIPHLYRSKEEELGNQIPIWLQKDKWFLREAVKGVLQYSLEVPPYAADRENSFSVDTDQIWEDIVGLAEQRGLNPADVNGVGQSTTLRTHLLLEDIVHCCSYDWNEIENGLADYPSLYRFLDSVNWKRELRDHNRHPLVVDLTNLEYEHTNNKLEQLNYCLSFVNISSDDISSLRTHLLDRHQYGDTLTELHVIALLRRYFGSDSVEIESSIPNSDKDTDTRIEAGEYNLRIEVTSPRQDDILRIGGGGTRSYEPVTNPARGPITGKARTQLDAAKQHTDDICAIAIQKRLFGVSDSEIEDYVLGQETVYIQDGQVGVGRDKSEIMEDDSMSNVDYLIIFGPDRQDVDLSDPSATLFVIHEPTSQATQDLQSVFDADIQRYQSS